MSLLLTALVYIAFAVLVCIIVALPFVVVGLLIAAASRLGHWLAGRRSRR